VRSYVSNRRRVLDPDRTPRTPASVLVTSGTGDSLEVPQDAVDALRFAAHTTETVRAEHDGDASWRPRQDSNLRPSA
jgi:hypothetical protein